ncbi:mechanosensitive ion channel family protein [Stakelama tenebrarum]|uniref:Small-conductance mechanosensitive channel n=1 Tax=Stakelama tenebrarum TaxID=2711215 RepID=A0A6G6Y959_9SPHN|nr:mechanosensitive ion channel family protein [Sphingosinithalassobacter tenebrarum]QIG81381.1 mechanosensitive ion channel family protein [Sphingosinithalassobacter tenebrarum]
MSTDTAARIRAPIDLVSDTIQGWIDGFYIQLPNIVAGLIFLVLAWILGRLFAHVVRRVAVRRGRPDLGQLLGSLAYGGAMIAALMVAAAIIFPSVHPGDILAALGIGSVAVGFAFKDILQNLFAGVLILLRRPFLRGDQIVVQGYEGTVEHIESRATVIKTYDGRRVIIPNADIYTSPVTVNTAWPHRRDEYDVGIGFGDHPAQAAAAFLDVLKGIDGIVAEPAPEALPWALEDSSVVLKLRWWTDSRRTDVVHVRARVILAVYEAAKAQGIDLPFPTQVLLFHDQTEESDGDRTRQREGWPAGSDPPKPRRAVVSERGGDAK